MKKELSRAVALFLVLMGASLLSRSDSGGPAEAGTSLAATETPGSDTSPTPSSPAEERAPSDAGRAVSAEEEKAWEKLVGLAAGWIPEGRQLSELLGPLPGEKELKEAGALPPAAFLALYEQSDERTRTVMERQVRSRLRELARRGVVPAEGVAALLGAEKAGVAGSEFFQIPEVPGEAFRALVHYLEYSAMLASRNTYEPTEASAARLERVLVLQLAVSAPASRAQYRDFDVVWSSVQRELACTDPFGRAALAPGVLWLYALLHESAGLSFLPALSPEMAKAVEAERGTLFRRGREESEEMPALLAALTQWRCGR